MKENTLKLPVGAKVKFIDGGFTGHTATIISHDEGRARFYYSVELDNPTGGKFVIGITDEELEAIDAE